MTLLDTGGSKFMSRDVSLIGLLRYFPLAQFTKARPVDSLGPFSLTIPRKRELSWLKTAPRPAAMPRLQTIKHGRIRVPARLFESPRHSGAADEGVTPRLLRVRIPGAYEDRRPAGSLDRPTTGPLKAPT